MTTRVRSSISNTYLSFTEIQSCRAFFFGFLEYFSEILKSERSPDNLAHADASSTRIPWNVVPHLLAYFLTYETGFVLFIYSSAGKFCPVNGLRQLTQDTKSDISCLQMSFMRHNEKLSLFSRPPNNVNSKKIKGKLDILL